MTFATVTTSGRPAAAWMVEHRGEVEALLLRDGAVLVTGAGVTAPADLAAIRAAMGRRPAELSDVFAPRVDHGDGVYSWPTWAADREMCLHHEQSLGVRFPGLLLMGALSTPDIGGALLLGDTRAVLGQLPDDLVVRFERAGWTVVRNFRPYLGLSWTDAFGTDDPAEFEKRCARDMVGCSWSKDVVRTAQRRSAIVTHPATGERCWFNDVAFFSQWSVPAAERGVLLSAFGPAGTPFNTFFGAGEPLSEEEYDVVMAAYEHAMVRVGWSAGDLLLVDNVLTAHGREPYTGSLDVAVALADPTAIDTCAPTVPPAAVDPF